MRTKQQLRQAGAAVLIPLVGLGLAACSTVLDVEFPGRIPAEQVDDPSLAAVLARSVIGDLECAYNNYVAANAAHSDEYETSNSNVPGANWGERTISADEDDYVIGTCEGTFLSFGLQVAMHTARFQAEDIFVRLNAWTDTQVADRKNLLAIVRTYGAFPYVFFGETYCEVAFDGADPGPPSASLAIAEQRFTEAIGLAQAASNTDMLNLARMGMARTKMDQKQWAEAAQFAGQVDVGYEKMADRGSENDRRFNKLFVNHTNLGMYVIADEYRTMNDPRVMVADGGRGAFNPGTRLWITTKYPDKASPIRLASYREAQLIQAEALAQQDQAPAAMGILNTRRLELGLPALTGTTQAEAVAAVIDERRKELSFEGGHRLNDLLRYALPWKGANGSTSKFNPHTARPYGATTCWPHPTKERSGA